MAAFLGWKAASADVPPAGGATRPRLQSRTGSDCKVARPGTDRSVLSPRSSQRAYGGRNGAGPARARRALCGGSRPCPSRLYISPLMRNWERDRAKARLLAIPPGIYCCLACLGSRALRIGCNNLYCCDLDCCFASSSMADAQPAAAAPAAVQAAKPGRCRVCHVWYPSRQQLVRCFVVCRTPWARHTPSAPLPHHLTCTHSTDSR